jgi:hypothetical protein
LPLIILESRQVIRSDGNAMDLRGGPLACEDIEVAAAATNFFSDGLANESATTK